MNFVLLVTSRNFVRDLWIKNLRVSYRTFVFRFFGIDHKGLVNHIRGPGNFRY
jgi:hypothetical protein